MSLRLYSGIQFASSDFYEVFQQLQSFRSRVAELTIETCGSYLANRITKMVDGAAANGEPFGKNYLSEAVNEFLDDVAEIVKTGRRNPAVDYEFKIEIMPFEGRLYGMIFTEQNWRKELLAQGWASEFGFWDCSDKPDYVSEDEWRERKRIWAGIMAPDYIPANHGVEMNLTMQLYWPEWEWIEPRFKNFEDRLMDVAKSRAQNAYMVTITANATDKEKTDGHAYFEAFFDAQKWIKTPEGQEAVATEIERVRPLLPRELTRQAVDGSLPRDVLT